MNQKLKNIFDVYVVLRITFFFRNCLKIVYTLTELFMSEIIHTESDTL